VPILPCVFVLALYAVGRRLWKRRAWLTLAALGLCVNLLGIVVHHNDYLDAAAEATRASVTGHGVGSRDDLAIVHFVPELSPPIGHAWLLARHLKKQPFEDGDWYPWRSMGSPIWHLDGSRDPTPPHLNLWWDGGAASWVLLLLMATALVVLSRQLWSVCLASPACAPGSGLQVSEAEEPDG
jgi:hypothetical protein